MSTPIITNIRAGLFRLHSPLEQRHVTTKPTSVSINVARWSEQHEGIGRLAEACPPRLTSFGVSSNPALFDSLREPSVSLYFAYYTTTSLFWSSGNVRCKRTLPVYSDYSHTEHRKKLTVREARLRARDIEARNLGPVQQSEPLSN